MATPILGITEISASQNQKEVTANQAFRDLEAATQDLLSIAITGHTTLTAAQFNRAKLIRLTGTPGADFNLTVPANKRVFVIDNQTGKIATIKRVTGATVDVIHDRRRLLGSDGVDIVALAPAHDGGAGGSGDVIGPASSVDGQLALFNGTTGKLLKTGAASSTLVIGPASVIDGRIALFDGTTGKLIKQGADPTTLVVGPASAVDGQLAVYNGTTGKIIRTSSASLIGVMNITSDAEPAVAPTVNAAINALAIGDNTSVSALANHAIAIGSFAVAADTAAIAIGGGGVAGEGASATGARAVAIGHDSSAAGTHSVALGQLAATSAIQTVAIGSDSLASATGAIALGNLSKAITGVRAIAIGQLAQAINIDAIALGGGSTTGAAANATAEGTIAIGRGTDATVFDAVAVGDGAQATAAQAIAIGQSSNVNAVDAIGIGMGAVASAANAIAIGPATDATSAAAIAVGNIAQATAVNAVAVGNNCTASHQRAVALGRLVSSRYHGGVHHGAAASSVYQAHLAHLHLETAGATPTSLKGGDDAAGIDISEFGTYAFQGVVVARTDADLTAMWETKGLIKRIGTATTLVYSLTTKLHDETAGLTLVAAANDTTERLEFTATGIAATGVWWSASLQIASVDFT